jgi:cell fate regulator YaaT (PSP1 superfamily)
MGCATCGSNGKGGKPAGCGSSGNSCSGGCNRMNTFDWLNLMDIQDSEYYDLVEVSFKNGARKDFFRNPPHTQVQTGDMVVVECSSGYDVGMVSLSGELVRLQMKKKKVREKTILLNVIRKANERDLEKLQEARELEKTTMIRAKAISRTLGLDMKIGDVEYQGDKRKATFFYTADGRVDFRELIRHYAKEFRVKIEMRQIGARQESARIGGVGSCGRELCCSTWLSDFKSVTTSAARYQNLAINQSKLSGQCGRLKCCLNYELDTYMDAISKFPKKVEKLRTQEGMLSLVKTDIFKQLMYYSLSNETSRGRMVTLEVSKVREIKEMNAKGEEPAFVADIQFSAPVGTEGEEDVYDIESVSDVIDELPGDKNRKSRSRRRKNRKKKRYKNSEGKTGSGSSNQTEDKGKTDESGGKDSKQDKGGKSSNRNRSRRNRRNRNKNRGRNQDKSDNKDQKN